METMYKGRKITITRPTLGNAFAIRCKITMSGETWHGTPGLLVADQLAEVRRQIDAVDARAPHVTARAHWYAPGTVEVCPRNRGAAYGQHLRFTGQECMDRGCVSHRVKQARAKARRYGITGASVSNLLATAGFTAYDERRAPHGFLAMGNQEHRAVSLFNDHDTAKLVPMGEALRAHGLHVVPHPNGFLWVYSRAEAIAQGLDVGPKVTAPVAEHKAPTTPAVRAALKRAGLTLAKPNGWGGHETEGLYVIKGEPGTVEVHWHSHAAHNDYPRYDASRVRGNEVIPQAAALLADTYGAQARTPADGGGVLVTRKSDAAAPVAQPTG